MTKTLADYTPEERQEMAGMWCRAKKGPAIIKEPVFGVEGWDAAVLCYPTGPGAIVIDAIDITPRFDLPRAWDKNGNPPPPHPTDPHNPPTIKALHTRGLYS